MRKEFSNELAPEVREKMKKNIVYLLMFSVFMIFAGLTSAYIVSMGDTFWLKYGLPTPFWISTGVIVVSSVLIQLSIKTAKQNNFKIAKLLVVSTFLLGIGFIYFQFKGYNELMDQGIAPVNNHIIVSDGRYGDYFEIKYKGQFVQVDGNDYFVSGHKMTDKELSAVQNFMAQFEKMDPLKPVNVENYGTDFILYHNQQPLALINGKLTDPKGQELKFVDLSRLKELAINVVDGRGDFFVKGKFGKDFHIYYKGKELQYKNREFYYNGKTLRNYNQIKIKETADTATAYLFLITILHLLHIVITLFFLFGNTVKALQNKFSFDDVLSLKATAIFWHFLGILWIYLLLFLLYIH